jgi:16S rRNA (guanine1207-N2)-methyltransferase
MKGAPRELARTTYWLRTVLEGFLPVERTAHSRLLDIGSADGRIAHFWVDKGGLATYCHYELDACRQVAALYGIPLRRHQNEGLPEDGCWLRGVGETGLEVAFTDLAPAGPYTLATFDTRAYEATYALEMVGHIAAGLEHSGWLLSVIDEKISTSSWQDRLNAWFEEVEVITSLSPRARGLSFFLARRPLQDQKPSVEYYSWQATFKNQTYDFRGAPGVFSPKALDSGTAFMLDVMDISPQERCLDLGCGTGAVAVVLSQEARVPMVAVDNNARALRLATENCQNNRADSVKIYPSDGFTDIESTEMFDVIACNPPYHTDFSVARRFIEGSFLRLREGGRLYLVVKRTDWYARKLKSLFGGCRRFTNDDGYTVFVAERQSVPKRPKVPSVGTRKHQKRLEKTSRRKRGRQR